MGLKWAIFAWEGLDWAWKGFRGGRFLGNFLRDYLATQILGLGFCKSACSGRISSIGLQKSGVSCNTAYLGSLHQSKVVLGESIRFGPVSSHPLLVS